MIIAELGPAAYLELGAGGARPVLLDVREDWEIEIARAPVPFVHIPLGELPARLGELDPQAETVVLCRSGARSLRAAQFLAEHGFRSVSNLAGGILAWSREVDPTIAVY